MFSLTRTELEALAADRPQKTVELFSANDFYGHATLLKEYCGWPANVPLPGIVPHGPHRHSNVWEEELNHRLPNLFLNSEIERDIYSPRCAKACHLIGSPYYYALRLLADELAELRRRAEGTIVFAAHSTSNITSHFDQPELIQRLRQLSAPFLPVRICIYWRDIQLGRHLPYVEAGFECLTAGHVFDPQFLRRLARILHQHRFAVSNELGTSLVYAAASGVGVQFLPHDIRHEGDNSACRKMGIGHELEVHFRFADACQGPLEKAGAQQAIAEQILGRAFLRKPAELRQLFETLADQLPVTSLKGWIAKKRWARLRRKASSATLGLGEARPPIMLDEQTK